MFVKRGFMKIVLNKVMNTYTKIGQYLGSAKLAPTKHQAQTALFLLGTALLIGGISAGATAQGLETNYNDLRVSGSVNAILTYMEGTFGALIMAAAGIGAILSSAFGQYKAALGCLIVAVGSFILRSFLATFFNDVNVQE